LFILYFLFETPLFDRLAVEPLYPRVVVINRTNTNIGYHLVVLILDIGYVFSYKFLDVTTMVLWYFMELELHKHY